MRRVPCPQEILRPRIRASAVPGSNSWKARHFRPLRITQGDHNGQSDNSVCAFSTRPDTDATGVPGDAQGQDRSGRPAAQSGKTLRPGWKTHGSTGAIDCMTKASVCVGADVGGTWIRIAAVRDGRLTTVAIRADRDLRRLASLLRSV